MRIPFALVCIAFYFGFAAAAPVLVTLNGKTYEATVSEDGAWSSVIPAADLALLQDGSHTVTVIGLST
ncbi:hypothetical protein OG21DRAFT_1500561 [Imleria badia]|nr:hypothetical protein OG21DRAFT_1500561 [Imleria badia]